MVAEQGERALTCRADTGGRPPDAEAFAPGPADARLPWFTPLATALAALAAWVTMLVLIIPWTQPDASQKPLLPASPVWRGAILGLGLVLADRLRGRRSRLAAWVIGVLTAALAPSLLSPLSPAATRTAMFSHAWPGLLFGAATYAAVGLFLALSARAQQGVIWKSSMAGASGYLLPTLAGMLAGVAVQVLELDPSAAGWAPAPMIAGGLLSLGLGGALLGLAVGACLATARRKPQLIPE